MHVWRDMHSLTWQAPSGVRADAGQEDICQVLEVDLVLCCKALEALSDIEEVPALRGYPSNEPATRHQLFKTSMQRTERSVRM